MCGKSESTKILKSVKKVKRMLSVAATSIGSCFTLYFLASLFGYLTFFNYVQSELLMTYSHTDPTNPLTIIVRCCVLIGEFNINRTSNIEPPINSNLKASYLHYHWFISQPVELLISSYFQTKSFRG